MDLTLTPTISISADETENDTPPHSTNNNLLSITTFHHLRSPMPPLTTPFPRYKECMKNHAAAIGGHAVDGCGEYISHDHTSLECSACGCHRNFHRRETHAPPPMPRFLDFRPPPISNGLRALTTAVEAAADDHHPAPETPIGENQAGRKRSRTKFSVEQREKMRCFSEKLGWRMQKSDEGLVEGFCSEIGVQRSVLKVWMHNNKNTIRKRLEVGNGGVGVIEFEGKKSDNGSCSSS